MKRIITIMAVLTVAVSLHAQPEKYITSARDEIKATPALSANNYRAYPDKDLPELTAAPEGYEPFFINHYGRHGSRWLHDAKMYQGPLDKLEAAGRKGKLTKLGKELLELYRDMKPASAGREGDLSDVGAEQHKGIGKRMTVNFPEVFAGNARVDARSTTVGRCILSMQNEVDQIKAFNPEVRLTIDASEHDMYYMNNHKDPSIKPLRNLVSPKSNEFLKKHVNVEKILKRLFKADFVRDSIAVQDVMTMWIFDGLSNLQSHHRYDGVDLLGKVFTVSDLYELWRCRNVYWYLIDGDAPDNKNRIVYFDANLVRSFLEAGDRAVTTGERGAVLRFGHESVLLPLVCLMGINGADYHTTDLETLDDYWRSYNIFPMACNVQMVYYRNKQNDILVKVLLNEHEATLPVATEQFPYYKWSEVRDYYVNKLASQPITTEEQQ